MKAASSNVEAYDAARRGTENERDCVHRSVLFEKGARIFVLL